ncbi:MAG: hypothetical protein E7Y34_00005, partial [Mycoplasma sp.]|nr:hypothetical protein [Mycoplasma sp.]
IIDKNVLSYAIEKTLAFAKDVFENPIIMNLNTNKLTLVNENEEYGTLESNIDKIDWKYEKFQIKFNANYLKEALKSFEGLIKIGFNNNDQAFVVSNVNDKELEYLILPYRILE